MSDTDCPQEEIQKASPINEEGDVSEKKLPKGRTPDQRQRDHLAEVATGMGCFD